MNLIDFQEYIFDASADIVYIYNYYTLECDRLYFGLGGVYFVTGHIVTKCNSFHFFMQQRVVPRNYYFCLYSN